jgi:ribosome maturation factor RimP
VNQRVHRGSDTKKPSGSSAVDTARLLDTCERSLKAIGYDLVEMEYLRDQFGWVLRVFIDHPQEAMLEHGTDKGSGITHSDCEAVSGHLGTVLDVEDVIPNAYRLEVSSPGVNRPLRKEGDFIRFIGHRVRVQLKEPHEGRKNFLGCLQSCSNGVVSVEVNGQVFQLPLGVIKRARLEVEL